MLAHMVYFSLHEPTAENRKKMVDACQNYLTGHPGEVFFSAGTCADYSREVNDLDYDIALVVVFEDRASHDAYQAGPAASSVHRPMPRDVEKSAGIRRRCHAMK